MKQSVLTEDHNNTGTQEEILLACFRKLSDDGRDKLMERAYELTKLYPKRKKSNGKTEAEI